MNEEIIPVEPIEPEVVQEDQVVPDPDTAEVEPATTGEPNRNIKRRIDRLGKKLADREAEVEYWREQAQRPKPDTPAASSQPTNTDKPQIKDFETFEEFTDALTDWKIEKLEAQRSERAAISEYNARVEKFRASAPDFVEAVTELGNVPKTIADFVLESDTGPAVIYHLANQPEEYERIRRLSPTRQAVALGAIESALAKESTKKPNKPAPAPISRLSGNVTAPVATADTASSFAEWKRARESQLKRGR